uniref:Disease resistance R13L4/SHOC-2-like LRR domain-containing protein n=1 Tax=Fagus sylvatica TaxID=28930 RepID=A0A2N9H9D1_FAGSY
MPLFPNLEELHLNKVSVKPLQQTMVMASSVPSSSSSPSPLSRLKDMALYNIEDDGGSLPDGWASNLNSLKSLVICNYPRLTSMSGAMQYLTSLEKLKIMAWNGAEDDGMEVETSQLPPYSVFLQTSKAGVSPCSCLKSLKKLRIVGFPNLTTFPEWISNFTSLEILEIEECPNLTSLPDGMCYLRFLLHLRIQDCLNLTTFPERISELTSLQRLEIIKCPNLTSLPDGMHGLRSLQILEIIKCPNLTSTARWDEWSQFFTRAGNCRLSPLLKWGRFFSRSIRMK